MKALLAMLLLVACEGSACNPAPAGPLTGSCRRDVLIWKNNRPYSYTDTCSFEGYLWVCNERNECFRKGALSAEGEK